MRKVYLFLDALKKVRCKLRIEERCARESNCLNDENRPLNKQRRLECAQQQHDDSKESIDDCCDVRKSKPSEEQVKAKLYLVDTMKNALAVIGAPQRGGSGDCCVREQPTCQLATPADTRCQQNTPEAESEPCCEQESPKDWSGQKKKTECEDPECPPKPPKLPAAMPVAPGKEVLWQNIKQVLRTCGGLDEPLCRAPGEVIVKVLEVQRFVSDVFEAMEVPPLAACDMADALIAADYLGHRSMGVHRLPAIAADLLNCTVDPRAEPSVLCERDALALIDGHNAPGPVVANFCMDLAMRKACEVGIGWVSARGSNCIGMASWYACQALGQRMIGLCMSNAPPTLVPSGGVEPVLGENPIACVAAGLNEQFLVDMGMSSFPIEQFELDYCNGQLRHMPNTLALDCQGRPTGCVTEALRAQRLRAFPPDYKGFGLAGMVDILCGVLSGAKYATQLRRRGVFSTENEPADLGQLYVAIDPRRFCQSFEHRLGHFHRLLRSVMPCKESQPPLVPGDREMAHMQLVDEQGGLDISPCTRCVLEELAERFSIEPLRIECSK